MRFDLIHNYMRGNCLQLNVFVKHLSTNVGSVKLFHSVAKINVHNEHKTVFEFHNNLSSVRHYELFRNIERGA
jgi:hypothetical protein